MPIEDNKDKYKNFKNLLRSVSLTKIKDHSQYEDLEIKEIDNSNNAIQKYLMCDLIISGRSMRIIFKVHFNIYESILFAVRAYNLPQDQIDKEKMEDFIKEYCNLFGGHVKRILKENNINVGTSLPLASLGFDEIFFSEKEATPGTMEIIKDIWQIDFLGRGIICSTYVELIDKEISISVNNINTSIVEEDEGEIDFL